MTAKLAYGSAISRLGVGFMVGFTNQHKAMVELK